ncbi:family 43 glycosylhydrolase [Planctomonas sp. JC2975]|uniref:chitobiase/beta-hexosaminidase C-terminal domain-containing protein n=1 Tax=Planctomonas sp. JC2975 TaxID=2729626 RepID=UPI0014751B94|nr:chitobiase/beta-hexosaminidase C-terminal domain-containing protein [Planctomonas sp. JC2975]NNC11826.1 family 43 glycosylhydrolase [Planctomonas sp. JC2975]
MTMTSRRPDPDRRRAQETPIPASAGAARAAWRSARGRRGAIVGTVAAASAVLAGMLVPAAANAADPAPTSLVAPVTVATTTGKAPGLPAQVAVNTAAGQQSEAVTWNLTGYTFSRAYQTYSVVGNVNGLAVTAQVEVVPPSSVYFVDSGMNASTAAYDSVSKVLGDSLQNKVADQQFTGSATWGYVNDQNAYVAQRGSTSTDKYATGLYALGAGSTSKPIIYDLPLGAGTYTVTAGFQEWWNNRDLNVSMVAADGTTTPIATGLLISTAGGSLGPSKTMVTGQFTVTPAQAAAGDEKLQVTIGGQSGAPVISWFGIAAGAVSIDTAPYVVAAPTANVAGGVYKDAQKVTLQTTTPNSVIYYTTDGSTASATNGTLASGPITVSQSETIDAVAFSDGTASKDTQVAYDIEPDPASYAAIPNGRTWYDTSGNPIQAHGGGVIKVGSWYYWIGENKSDNTTKFSALSMYKSQDLTNWTFDHDVLTASSAAALADCNIERPKIVYDAQTKTFVLWAHWERASDYSASHLMVATSSSVDGDYTFQHDFRPGAGQVTSADADPTYTGGDDLWGYGSRDFTVYQDPSSGEAYIVSTQNGTDMRVYRLIDGDTDVDWQDSYVLFAGQRREAPALVKVGDYYFVFTSSQSGWYPNQAMYAYTKNIADPNGWSALKPVGNNTTFYSQPTSIVTVQAKGGTQYLYAGDHWNPETLGASTYVWLPLDFTGTDGAGPGVSMSYQPTLGFASKTGLTTSPAVQLVSQGKPATASSTVAGHPAGDAVDGNVFNLNTSGDDTNFFQPSTVPYTWQVDLGRTFDLSRVDLSWRSYNGSETYSGYTVEGSTNGTDWTRIASRLANRSTGFTSDGLSGSYRYVRVSVSKVVNDHNGNEADWAAGLVEVQVYAIPVAQSITFRPLHDAALSTGSFALSAVASSGEPVSYTASGTCTVSGSTVQLTAVGTCKITAGQAGGDGYTAASSVTRPFDVVKG